MEKPTRKGNCLWQTQSTALQAYHDHEWGRPVNCDHILFEKISLETLQAGLSWRTVLDKRDAIRACFKQFNINKVMVMTPQEIQTIQKNPKVIRNPKKNQAIVHNAGIAYAIQQTHGSFAKFVYQFKPELTEPIYAVPQAARQLCQALKARHWQFIGNITCYSFMQAAGIINDHDLDCPIRDTILK